MSYKRKKIKILLIKTRLFIFKKSLSGMKKFKFLIHVSLFITLIHVVSKIILLSRIRLFHIKHFLISGNYFFYTSKNSKTVPHNFIYLPISENFFLDSIKSNYDIRNFCLDQNTLIAWRNSLIL